MRIFSLDTSFSFINFSVIENGKVLEVHYIDSPRKTLEEIPYRIERAGIKLSDFDGFAVSLGVGYLTSLRIGVTFMKTTAYMLKKPIVSYENLSLMARFTPVPYPRVPFLKVSTNVFYRICTPENETEVKIHRGERVEGTGISLEVFKGIGLCNKNFYHPFFPFSAYGGIVASKRLEESPEGEDPFKLEPLYLKPPL